MIFFGEKINEKDLKRLRKGDVLLWENFPLKTKDKDSRFVVLVGCDASERLLVIRATSSLKALSFYKKGDLEIVWIEENKEKLLPKVTILDFNRAIAFLDIQKMIPIYGKTLKRIGKLSEGLIDSIDEVVKKSKIVGRRLKKRILESERSEFDE